MVLCHTDMFNKYCLWAAPSISFLSGIGVFYGGTPLQLLILLHHVCSLPAKHTVIHYFVLLLCWALCNHNHRQFMFNFLWNTLTCFVCVTCQSVLGAEGLSLAFRHIVSSLLWYCTQHSSEELLHEVIICVGYFTVNHTDNQVNQTESALTEQFFFSFKQKSNHSKYWYIHYFCL